jgi:5-methylcytosine-specific restriction endonuclease McrA
MALYMSQVGCCVDCEKTFSPNDLTLHHVPPKSEGGSNSSGANFLLCRACHNVRHEQDDEIQDEANAEHRIEERRTLENAEMEKHFEKHPHG